MCVCACVCVCVCVCALVSVCVCVCVLRDNEWRPYTHFTHFVLELAKASGMNWCDFLLHRKGECSLVAVSCTTVDTWLVGVATPLSSFGT